jgi:hypothetical protein
LAGAIISNSNHSLMADPAHGVVMDKFVSVFFFWFLNRKKPFVLLIPNQRIRHYLTMKKLFYIGLAGIILYEIAKVYFIMPMPGSQRMNSVDLAYFLHSWRWMFRICLWGIVLMGSSAVFKRKQKWLPGLFLLMAISLTYISNYKMAADTMFYQPGTLILRGKGSNKVPEDKLVIGISLNGESKAYPIQFIGYHHQVQDVLGGKPVIVTYCTVCRTGRVFEPLVNGRQEHFRLVGMDHFNAMFEDESTNSWWRQVNGEAIAGSLKGTNLPELASTQTSLGKWLLLHPDSKIMQPDPAFTEQYTGMTKYESGKGKSSLTRTDSLPWLEKSWVVGIRAGKSSKAFDWKRLEKERVVNEKVGGTPIVLVIASDNKSFFAFKRLPEEIFQLRNDTIFTGDASFNLLGKNISGPAKSLEAINAYQEFWHSWRTFHPGTERY